MDRNKAKDAVRTALVEHELTNNLEFSLDHRFDEDLGIDDLEELELLMALEQELEIKIPDEDVHALQHQTVGWLVDYLVDNH